MSRSPAPSAAPVTDAQLLQALRAGDEPSFVMLVERYQATFLRVAAGFTSSQAVAAEVVQETWTAVLQALPSFEGRSSIKTWLFRILINRARTRAEREGRSVPFSALEPADGASEPDAGAFSPDGHWASPVRRWDENTPEVLLLRAETVRVLEGAMASLPAQQRTVVTLRDVEGLESGEVCNVLGISESNQRVLLHRARVRLRTALVEYLEGEG